MFEVNNNTGHIYNFVYPAAIVKSKMAVIEPFFIYLIKTNIECFSFESIMHVIGSYREISIAIEGEAGDSLT